MRTSQTILDQNENILNVYFSVIRTPSDKYYSHGVREMGDAWEVELLSVINEVGENVIDNLDREQKAFIIDQLNFE